MFVVPSLLVGALLALVLGGKPARVLALRFRLAPLVPVAFALQLVLFTRIGASIGYDVRAVLHVTSYGMLLAFGAANLRLRPLALVMLGTVLNAAAIAANHGRMPVSARASDAAGVSVGGISNLSPDGHRLHVLGDVFALPQSLPFANVFSIGDLLIALGAIALVVTVSLEPAAEPVLSVGRLAQPLREQGFRRLATGKLVSQVGDWLTTAALVGWLYNETGSTAEVALLMLARLVPPIVGSSAAAMVVDRVSKKRLLVTVELVRGVFVLGAFGAVATGERPLVFVAIAGSGALAATSAAATPALVPALLPVSSYESANAVLGISENVAMAIGSASAGIALTSVGVEPALVIDTLTFVAAAVLFTRLPAAAAVRAPRRARGPITGLRYLLARRSVLVLVGSFAAATLATGLANVTLPRFLERGVGLGPGGYGFGFAALAVGLALGEGSMGFVHIGDSAGRWIGAGLALMASLFGLLALVNHAPTALLVLAAIGFVDGTTDIVFDTAVQRDVDPQFHGAVFGFASAAFRTTMMAAVLAAPIVNDLLPPGRVLLFTAFFLSVASLIAWTARARPAPLLRAAEIAG